MHVTGRAKVAADDYEVCVIEVLDRLELYNDLVLHDEVETMATDLLLPEQDSKGIRRSRNSMPRALAYIDATKQVRAHDARESQPR